MNSNSNMNYIPNKGLCAPLSKYKHKHNHNHNHNYKFKHINKKKKEEYSIINYFNKENFRLYYIIESKIYNSGIIHEYLDSVKIIECPNPFTMIIIKELFKELVYNSQYTKYIKITNNSNFGLNIIYNYIYESIKDLIKYNIQMILNGIQSYKFIIPNYPEVNYTTEVICHENYIKYIIFYFFSTFYFPTIFLPGIHPTIN